MKSKSLAWFLVICILCATTALSQQQQATPAGVQTPGNLSQDVILVPVDDSALAAESKQADEPFSINATFDDNVTQEQRAVIQHAINEWVGIIRTRGFTPGNYPISFSNGALTGSQLALTTTTFGRSSGDLRSATMVFDNRPSTTWYVDPNPADNVEFDGTPPAGNDLLSVARHELGHALGWSDTSRVTGHLSGGAFDQGRFNIATVGDGGRHTDPNIHANDVMNPELAPSTRRPISLYPAATMLARAYSYDIIMNFVDSAHTGDERGSANAPWNTVREGADLARFGLLLLTPRTYDEVTPLTLSRPMIITVARGGAALVR
jgi:hypothetical protein